MAAASVDTKNPRRDKHLRSADFFDVDNHKDITFTAEGATPAGDGVRITGTLTVRGVTRRPLSTRRSRSATVRSNWTASLLSTAPTSG